jgi:D-alanine-D-alanine ligase
LRLERPDIVFNRAEGVRGESRESQVPAFCEMLGIPYTGAGIMATAICLDKPTTKKVLEWHGVRTAPFTVLYEENDTVPAKLRYPIILKPSHEGSSIGINIDNVVHDENQFRKKLAEMLKVYKQGILAEEFIDGREFSVGIVGNFIDDEKPRILPIFEVDFSKFAPELGTVLGQKAKTIYDTSANYICPAKIQESLKREIEETTLKAARILQCNDWGRLDFRYNDHGELYFLEINPLPGIDADPSVDDFSFYPFMWMRGGWSFDDMIREVVAAGLKRYGIE